MQFEDEIRTGRRFEFGTNWRRFLDHVTEEDIEEARNALRTMLGDIRGKTFLDVGCGSGLSSLVARQLGAKVHSFDFDPQSVACAEELKRRERPNDGDWTIERGSTLDKAYLEGLGKFDIVYSWGVLHHTGDMWSAMEMVCTNVGETLFIAIYNDAHRASRFWRVVKHAYNATPRLLRWLLVIPLFIRRRLVRILIDTFKGQPLRSWQSTRGMNPWTDFIDWIGGYPYEFAKPEEIFYFWQAKGFRLERLSTTVGTGCNEYVFRRNQ